MNKRKKNLIGFSILFLFVGIGILIAIIQDEKLHKDHNITTGYIKEVVHLKGGGAGIRYHFIVFHKSYYGQTELRISNPREHWFLDSLLTGKYLPVAFQTTNPDNNKMILSSKDCKDFNAKLVEDQQVLINIIDSLERSQ